MSSGELAETLDLSLLAMQIEFAGGVAYRSEPFVCTNRIFA